jgi:GMP synthase (glutamine-hydrolysing)
VNILIVDNTIDRDSWGAGDLRRLARVANGAELTVRRAPERDLPASPRGFDRIILSGSKTSALEDSPWISDLLQFVQTALNENIPFLGVCYGHQTLARVLGGKSTCRRSEIPEVGWTKIEVIGESPLLQGLPKTFHSFSSHFEEVGKMPKDLKLLARSEACGVQACQLGNRPVFGIQFHPEKDILGAENIFAQKKKTKIPKTLLNSGKSKELYDPQIGERIFKNFLELG